jgi:hypothetical protein
MENISEVLRGWLGWCPNTQVLDIHTSAASTGKEPSEIAEQESPGPGILPKTLTTPHWMTVTALVILFATCFVGGSFWWPFFVIAVLIACVVCLYYQQYWKVG